jgi:hemoglobin
MIQTDEITRARLALLVERFYEKVRQDALIGPVFLRSVEDWDAHLSTLTDFWCAVMLGVSGFKGHPMGAHLRLADEITPPMFARWLALWDETTAECFAPAAAAALQARAAQIGRNFQTALFGRPDAAPQADSAVGAQPAAPAAEPTASPGSSSPIFSESSLPASLRREHRTKAGVWGVIRVLEGRRRLHVAGATGTAEARELAPDRPGLVEPTQAHWVEPLGPMRMRIEFHDARPSI